MRPRTLGAFALALTTAVAPSWLAAQSADHAFDLATLQTVGSVERAETVFGRPGLIVAPDSRLELPTPDGVWGANRYAVTDVRFDGEHSGVVVFEFFGERSSGKPRMTAKLGLLPGLPTRLVLPLSLLGGQQVFAARRPRQLKGVVLGGRVDPAALTRVSVHLVRGNDPEARLHVDGVRLTKDRPEPMPAVAEPVVDEIGQWTRRSWSGKAMGVEQMVARLREARASAVRDEASPRDGLSRFGGFQALRFDATGWFRTAQHDGRHWLVDPDGCAFFSVGPDCVGLPGTGPVEGMRDLFAWLPERDDVRFKDCYSKRHGRDAFSFGRANLVRAFGNDWWSGWFDVTRAQLRSAGCNTIGNWSSRDFVAKAKMPWVLPLSGFPWAEPSLFRDFPDVFSDDYVERSSRFARRLEPYKDDPYLIGYFLRNEPQWGFGRHNLAREMVASATRSATRGRLVEWLQERYGRGIAAISEAWGVEIASWDALAGDALVVPDGSPAVVDLWEFSEVMVERYLRVPSEALRAVDPHHLNLGIRYAWISSDLCYVAAGKLFDVFSLNVYADRPRAKEIAKITQRTGLPVLIGEFHHGGLDRGLPSTGIRGVPSQQSRADAYCDYMECGAALPSLVGAHYFQWNDQPVTGRFDGENYNIGFVDVCLRPHAEFFAGVKRTNASLFDVLTGKRKPRDLEVDRVDPVFF